MNDFIVCIDRIIASTACFGSVDTRNCDGGVDPMIPVCDNDGEGCSASSNKYDDDDDVDVVECRICQEEDEVQTMESPCSCNGTLKEFSPNYSLPPVRSNAIMAIDIRQEWGHNADLHVALASAEHQLLQTEYEDYAMSQTSSIACLRSATLLLLIILLVRQALMVAKNSTTGQDVSIIFNFEMSLLQFSGVLLPCYAMARSWYTIQNRRRRQV